MQHSRVGDSAHLMLPGGMARRPRRTVSATDCAETVFSGKDKLYLLGVAGERRKPISSKSAGKQAKNECGLTSASIETRVGTGIAISKLAR
jgi:hypothetical protein